MMFSFKVLFPQRGIREVSEAGPPARDPANMLKTSQSAKKTGERKGLLFLFVVVLFDAFQAWP